MKSITKILTLTILLLDSLCMMAYKGRTYQVINAADELADNSAQIVICTKTGRMVISTLGNLNFYNGASFTHIGVRNDMQYQLPRYQGNYRLYFDRKHHIWLKNTHTLTCVDLMMEEFIVNVDSVVREMGGQEQLEDLFVDSVGNVWFLSDKGLYGVNNQKTYHVLRDQNLQDVDVFGNLLLTFYGNGEEVGQDIQTGRTVHRSKAYDWDTAQRYLRTSAILRYGDGYYQVRNGETESVFLHFDVKQLKWTVIQTFPFHVKHLTLHDDCIYLPSERGYGVYDIKKGEMDWVSDFVLTNGLNVQSECNMIAFDRQDGMWIGTENRGVLYARPSKLMFHSYSCSHPEANNYLKYLDEVNQNITEFHGLRANCMFMDSRGWSWIGTSQGLYLYKTPQSEPIVFSRKNGFYNNVVHTVVEDKNHNIWAATSNGISFVRIDGEEVVFVNSFNAMDGVPCESFVNCKGALLADGSIAMQTIDHLVLFNPADLEEVNTPHPYLLYPKRISLRINGNNMEPGVSLGDNVVIDRALSRARTITLSSNLSSVSLTFSALNYFRPLQSYYRVRIKGIEEYNEWKCYSYFNSGGRVDSKGMLHIPLLAHTPGNYKLELQVSMYPDQWEGDPLEWEIIIMQPWWQTTGVLWILGIVIFLTALGNFVFYMRNERMRIRRNQGEGDIIRKIRQFVERCNSFSSEMFAPIQDDYRQESENSDTKLNPEFIQVMMLLLPYVQDHMKGELTMAQLSSVAEMDVVSLYELIMADIYKSPRDLARIIRLERVANMLTTTDKTVSQISEECGFSTPNYLIGTFYHQYKMTPKEYRENH